MNNEPIAYIPDTGLKTLQDGSWCVANAVKMGDSDIPLYTHPVKELTLSIGEIHAVWAAGKYYELDKNGQVDEIKFTEFAYAILKKAQEK